MSTQPWIQFFLDRIHDGTYRPGLLLHQIDIL